MKNSTYYCRQLFLLLLLFLAVFSSGYSQQIATGITAKNGEYYGFYEYKPAGYATSSTKYPLIIFLHGGGETGNGTTDLAKVASVGGTPPRLIKDGHNMTFDWNGKTESFIVLSPQCNNKYSWWQDWQVTEILEYALKNLKVDPDRIFLTGLSMGGGGTWQYAGRTLANAKQFAALGVSCGACSDIDWCNFAKANLPIWAFHAKDDGPIPVTCTEAQIDKIKACNPAVQPYMTIWPTGGHGIWGRVYDPGYSWQNPNLYEWFLGQNRGKAVNKRPVAVASDVTITTTPGTATLDASASTDADGKIVRYVFSKLSGPSAGTITTPVSTDGRTTITGLTTTGTYTYEVKVVDDRADWVTKTVTVTVNAGTPGATKPIANAGADILVYTPATTATLDGSASYHPDTKSSIAKYAWTQLNGPVSAKFSSTSVAKPELSGLSTGVYTFRLTVTDTYGNTASDDVVVTVKVYNIYPVVNAGADQTITLPTSSVTLDASGSKDPDGSLKAFEWSWVSGPSTYTIVSPSAMSTVVKDLKEGVYEFKVRVWDDLYDSANDTVKITVKAATAPVNQPPVAQAGKDISITLPTSETTLDGSASSDPENKLSSYAWKKTAGGNVVIASAKSATTKISGLEEGSYSFVLTVTDSEGLTNTDTVRVVVNPAPPPANKAPTANAGKDLIITLPTSNVTLSGSASTDPDGSIASYAWSYISGPAGYKINSPATVSTTVTGLAEGTYRFKLVVTDNGGLTAADTVQVTVKPKPNEAPTANAGKDLTITLPTSSVTLSGSASTDPDGSIASYAWSYISGPAGYKISSPATVSTTVTGLAEGTYRFKLLVTDNGGLTATDTVQVTVKPKPNEAPTANAGKDLTITLPTSSVTLSGSASTDPDGSIASYTWSYISGPAGYKISSPATVSTTVTGLAEGTYRFKLVVTDNGGLTAADTVQVTVKPKPNEAPTANAGKDLTITLPTSSVTLSGSASTDPDGSIASYAWSYISGPAGYKISSPATVSTTVTGLAEGTYRFKLVVTDNGGLTAADTLQVTVKPMPVTNKTPVADAGDNIELTFPIVATMLNGTRSYDPDGKIVSYTWSRISGPAAFSLALPNQASTLVLSLEVGTYQFRLEVKDDGGLTAADTVQVKVLPLIPPPNQAPVASAGKDIVTTLPQNQVTLNGSLSSDPDGTITAYAWSWVSGPTQYKLSNPAAVSTTLSNLVEGTYAFKLQVTDNSKASSYDTIRVTVLPEPNKAPVASAGNDFSVYLPNPVIRLNGTGSSDPDGSISSWSWKKISGPGTINISNATKAEASVLGVQAGEYVFELTIADNKGATASARVKVTVLPTPNLKPVANAGKDTGIAVPASTVFLSGANSYDPDGVITQVTWKKVQGPASFFLESPGSVTTAVGELIVGEYIFELSVTDNKGATAKDSVKVSVVNNFRYEERIRAYPNPVRQGTLNLLCMSDSAGQARITIFDMEGRLVRVQSGLKAQSVAVLTVPVAGLRPGVYTVEVRIGDRKRLLTRFVKQ
ncbi:MAG: PKD domain-containing protein [Candidatus Pseudobacter hemicellulosilyticus]|uniref:PKD domain-containing protein n=1 Tax=Candidatus Pseudobacter hemicellulosilyticus TaxID=3121375 RepID=A0AAJ5WSJ2_9BACT|nr:MAG: PKD domain-containing protein [Pseudobacter sp.]